MNWIAEKPKDWDGDVAVILAHGAGQGMSSPFMTFFHMELARRGFLSIKFNFDYMEAGRKVPDRQPVLQSRYRQIFEEVRNAHKPRRTFIGGKSMGGRVASYIANDAPVPSGLIFLGYPLHPPGKTEQLRDAHLYETNVPMLFVSGTQDNLAQRDLLQQVTQTLGRRATLHWIEGGNHSLEVRRKGIVSWPASVDVIVDWIRKI